MLLSELLRRGTLILDLNGRTTEEALGEITDGLILAGCVGADERERVLINLLKREAVSTTGLGDRVALPHAKLDFIDDFVGAFGFSERGIDFHSADGRAVKFVFLLLSPNDDPYGHLRLLGTIATLIRHDGFLEELVETKSAEDALSVIEAKEKDAFQE